MENRIIFKSDENVTDHADFIVFVDREGCERFAHIDRESLDSTGKVLLYVNDLCRNPFDYDWALDKIDEVNATCDTAYDDGMDLYSDRGLAFQFMSDICSYFGALNIDGQPREMNWYEFENWISDLEGNTVDGWHCTDPDTLQFCKRLDEKQFRFKTFRMYEDIRTNNIAREALLKYLGIDYIMNAQGFKDGSNWFEADIDLNEYSQEELYSIAESYYGGQHIERFMDDPALMAEMVYETDCEPVYMT